MVSLLTTCGRQIPDRLSSAWAGCPLSTTLMPPLRFLAFFGLIAGTVAAAHATEFERNVWPGPVTQFDQQGQAILKEAAGPLLFKKSLADGSVSSGFRPIYVQTRTATGELSQALFVYPLFAYAADAETFRWSVFELVKRSGRKADAPPLKGSFTDPDVFEVWPFWFSRQDRQEPTASYRALFPIAGTLKNRFGYQQLSWTLFPFYVRSEKRDVVTTATPWPILRVTRGSASGFALWPLFGWQNGPGETRQRFYLWPLGYNNSTPPPADAPANSPPSRQVGFLPFYTREQSPGFVNENFGWPFFGYTDRTTPYRYHETRYFWPFFVQGRGDDRFRNRWGPFYTHSVVKGYDKTWIGWPIYRQAQWTDEGITQTKRQVFFFLYFSLDQQSATNPTLPHAHKTHVWPLYSSWDNGAGRRQFQLFSPFEVFFPSNDKVRQVWTPLAAIYRQDRPAPGYARQSFLWNLVTLRRTPERSEFHLGPLFSVEKNPEKKRVALGNGLVSLQRDPASQRWHLSWWDFPAKRSADSTSAFAR